MTFQKSLDLMKRAEKRIPSISQTFSKGPNQWARGVTPHYLQRGEGAWVWDADGNRFLDHVMALGPVILGYDNDRVNTAIREQLKEGIVFSQMHPLEVEVAELLCDIIPCAEMVRFGKTGSDVTTAAVRVSRAFTGRDRIAMCGYHGWHDWYIGTTTRSLGVPQAVQDLSHTFAYNDLDSLKDLFEKHPGEFAAVIMEPVGVVDPDDGFLEGVKALAKEAGAVLIFDEVVTGFRMALGGAQEYYGVEPDLACFGKAMGNGMPISAVVGRADIMNLFDDIFFSGTFNGEALSLASCKATLEELRATDGIAKIWTYGDALIEGIEKSINDNGLNGAVTVIGKGFRSILTFPHNDEKEMLRRRTYFMQECVKQGLLYFCLHMPSAAHGEKELAFTLKVINEVMTSFAMVHQADDFENRLEGPCVEAVFRKA
ncbi:MAG: aminotransferase class III-fold pyridoxal phosphate-dependent enzyme [Mariprofundaceae bacterium]|nr:aminotransferase class III-fold pyridoxal phosphate-dependent enzyme [Mariprofundaceae bacterium]